MLLPGEEYLLGCKADLIVAGQQIVPKILRHLTMLCMMDPDSHNFGKPDPDPHKFRSSEGSKWSNGEP